MAKIEELFNGKRFAVKPIAEREAEARAKQKSVRVLTTANAYRIVRMSCGAPMGTRYNGRGPGKI